MRYGVPQGSGLDPLVFTVYASALFDVVEKHLLTVHCYDDDSQLYISFSSKAHSGHKLACVAGAKRGGGRERAREGDDGNEHRARAGSDGTEKKKGTFSPSHHSFRPCFP